jgi:hypothetical protein
MSNRSLRLLLLTPLSGCIGCRNISGYEYREVAVLAVIAGIMLLFIFLAIYSNLLRDGAGSRNPRDQGKNRDKPVKRDRDPQAPFSLVKVQFGVWTVIICSSYIYLSLCKGDCTEGSVNKTALVLLGIFSGTAVASSVIDKRELQQGVPRYQDRPSQGFFTDILSDENGISMHRFQSFAWTLIAMTVYLYKLDKVQAGCVLPELSDTLLSLTGISNATYLVLRTKENDRPEDQDGVKDEQADPPLPGKEYKPGKEIYQ